MARGLGLAHQLTDDSARRARVVAQWAGLIEKALREAGGDADRDSRRR